MRFVCEYKLQILLCTGHENAQTTHADKVYKFIIETMIEILYLRQKFVSSTKAPSDARIETC